MNTPRPLLFASLLLLPFAVSPLTAAQDTPPVDALRLLQMLEKFEAEQNAKRDAGIQQVIQQLRNASSQDAAMELYLNSIQATQFVGETKENTRFKEWREKNVEKLRDPGFRLALAMQTHWLAMTLARQISEEPEKMTPDVASFASEVAKNREPLSGKYAKEIMNASVSESPQAKMLGVSHIAKGGEDWELAPGRFESIMEKTVLPVWRKNRDPKVMEYWDLRLAVLRQRASEATLEMDRQNLMQVEIPGMEWNRAKEFAQIGQPNRGLEELWKIFMAHPNHRQAPQWAATIRMELQNILNPPPPPEAGIAAPADAPLPTPTMGIPPQPQPAGVAP